MKSTLKHISESTEDAEVLRKMAKDTLDEIDRFYAALKTSSDELLAMSDEEFYASLSGMGMDY